jgi:flagellar hook-length control protein FliK
MTPSNDEKPSRLGLDVPQIVREVQSIVARPANAAGGNLVQAHQQGDAPVQQALNAPAQPGNTAPLSQNAGQGAPLHVGADGSGNAGQNTNQNAGQSGNNPNGQSPNGQSANGQAANGQSGIAGAPPNGPLAEGMAAQQSAQSFQSNLARSTGPVGAGGPGPVSADGSTMARGDGAISGTGSSQGTLSSDPASRAAQASTPHLARNGAATDQVSVSLKKAVENGDSKLRIQLRPHDLGKVEVKLDIAGDGRAKAMILAERPETLELLQRDSRVLERALQDAGLKTDHNSLSFDLQGRDGEERTRQAQRGDEDGKGSPAEPGGGDAIENSEHPIPATAIGLAPDGSVNFLA